jgi:hypothetical protein
MKSPLKLALAHLVQLAEGTTIPLCHIGPELHVQ